MIIGNSNAVLVDIYRILMIYDTVKYSNKHIENNIFCFDFLCFFFF